MSTPTPTQPPACPKCGATTGIAHAPYWIGDIGTWQAESIFTCDCGYEQTLALSLASLPAPQGEQQDSRTPTVAPGGQPLPQADSKDGFGDSVSAQVEPPGATLSPCAASTAITPAIADALAKARLFVLCALRREGCRFTYHDQPEHWGERLLEAIEKATPQVDRGESSSEGGES